MIYKNPVIVFSSVNRELAALDDAKYAVANQISYQRDLMIKKTLDQNWVEMVRYRHM